MPAPFLIKVDIFPVIVKTFKFYIFHLVKFLSLASWGALSITTLFISSFFWGLTKDQVFLMSTFLAFLSVGFLFFLHLTILFWMEMKNQGKDGSILNIFANLFQSFPSFSWRWIFLIIFYSIGFLGFWTKYFLTTVLVLVPWLAGLFYAVFVTRSVRGLKILVFAGLTLVTFFVLKPIDYQLNLWGMSVYDGHSLLGDMWPLLFEACLMNLITVVIGCLSTVYSFFMAQALSSKGLNG